MVVSLEIKLSNSNNLLPTIISKGNEYKSLYDSLNKTIIGYENTIDQKNKAILQEVKWKSKLQKTETLFNTEINQFKADLEDKRKFNEYNEQNLQEMNAISIMKGRKFKK